MGKGSVWDSLSRQVFLGGKEFIEATKSLHEKTNPSEIRRRQRYAYRPTLNEVSGTGPLSRAERNLVICRAHLDYGYTLKEIADFFGIHYTSVSKIIKGKT